MEVVGSEVGGSEAEETESSLDGFALGWTSELPQSAVWGKMQEKCQDTQAAKGEGCNYLKMIDD